MSLTPLLIAAVGLVTSPCCVRASTQTNDTIAAGVALLSCVASGGVIAAAMGAPASLGTAVGGIVSMLAVLSA